MENNLDYIILKTQLEQTEFFKEDYEKSFDLKPKSQIFSDFTAFSDIAELLNQISTSYDLTDYQRSILFSLFVAFDKIRTVIDPLRLKSFDYGLNEDDELVLYRNTENGLTNLILFPEECFAFSFISKDGKRRIPMSFYYEDFDDFEKIAYMFFS